MPERKCHACTRQKEWGCEAEKVPSDDTDPTAERDANGQWWGWSNPSALPLQVDGETVWACPRRDLKDRGRDWNRMLFYYGFYQKGHLPQPGAIIDQSNMAMEVFRVLDQVNAECDNAEVERRAHGRERDRQAQPTRR